MSVAINILEQLGGNRFATMVGAKNLVSSENSLTFKFGRNGSKSNHVIITLKASDTYHLSFGHIRKYKWITDKEFDNIYADQLEEIFKRYTKLNTRLF